MAEEEMKHKIEDLKQMLANKEEEYKHAVKLQKKYDVLRALRDEIRELKNSLRSTQKGSQGC